MFKKSWRIFTILVLCSLFTQPVMAAATDGQGGGGVRFGSYTLDSGNTTSGDLVIIGGPVSFEEDSYFDGDLTVFGQFDSEIGSTIDGQLVVLGEAHIAGLIDGNVFVAGPVDLDETAYIDGDLSVVGEVSQEEGAVVEGEIIPIDESDWQFPINIDIPDPIVNPDLPQPGVVRTPFWIRTLTAIARAVATVVILTLLSLVVASLWPQHIERVGRTIEEAPLISFGTGLLTLVVALLAAVLLTITICLSPFAIIGLIVVSLGVLLGWIALGLILGRRVLSALFNIPQPKTMLAAVVGTGLLTTLLAMSQVFGFLQTLLVFLLIPPVAGAVLLTRFGTMPYATRGGAGVSPEPRSGTPAPVPQRAPLPGESLVDQQDGDTISSVTELEIDVAEQEQENPSSPVGSIQVVEVDDDEVVDINAPEEHNIG